MRRRAWVAWGLLALGLALGLAGQVLPGGSTWDLFSGLFVAVAIGLAVSLLPFWRRWLAPLVPMPDLFQAPRPTERWCARCGHPTARRGPCRTCGHTPASGGR